MNFLSSFDRFMHRGSYLGSCWTRGALVAAGAVALLAGVRRLLAKPFSWQERRIVIMGASRGLGLLLALECLRRGARVVITGRNQESLEHARAALLRHCDGQSNRVFTVRCDVEDASDVEHAIGLAREHLGGIDVLVNNAGQIQVGPLESMQLEDFDQAMHVHFRGPLVATLAVLDEMRARRSGSIVNISSIGGLVSVPHLLPYVASKFALTGLSQGLRAELAKDGIDVTTVCPGLMRTGSSHRALFKSQHRLEHAWFALGAATPLTSMSAERAVRTILTAVERGKPFIVLSWQAKLLALTHALAPDFVARTMSLVARYLPAYGGIGKDVREGIASASGFAPSVVTSLNDKAARELGELGPPELAKQ